MTRGWITIGKFFLTGLLVILLLCFYLSPTYFCTADLGRHIKNGEIFLTQNKIIRTNHYSYTTTDRPVVTHHWGAGCVFYLIWQWWGFQGVSVFYATVLLAAFLLIFAWTAWRNGFRMSFVFAVLVLPFLADRAEIRPEGFSYLFFVLMFIVFDRYRREKLPLWLEAAVILGIALWVNTHIFFVFGLFLVLIFWGMSLIVPAEGLFFKQRSRLLLCSFGAALFNPWGIRGVIEPLMIFRDFGYRLAENQTVLFMARRFPGEFFYIYAVALIMFLFFIIVMVLRRDRKNWREHFFYVLMLCAFGVLGWRMNRMLHFLGLVVIPCGAYFAEKGMMGLSDKTKKIFKTMVFLMMICVLGGRSFGYGAAWFMSENYFEIAARQRKGHPGGLRSLPRSGELLGGLMPNVNRSAEFFVEQNIAGPIFNNYDIGSYLIFHLFPRWKVFVDNRPEAYGADFFQDVYIPMQEDEQVWQAQDDRFGFNAIFFYRHDLTTWAQPFLIRRIRDPLWAPVFVDQYTIILLKRNETNRTIIERFELPQDMFRVGAPSQ